MLVVTKHLRNLYDEVSAVFNELVISADIIFPDAQYRYFAVCAIILEDSGNTDGARDCAAKALRAASMEHSGFSRHPHVGLVQNRNKEIDAKLQKMVHPGWLERIKSARRDRQRT